ncbi:3580_t:CDS:1, partial [Funneliformis mosseae]
MGKQKGKNKIDKNSDTSDDESEEFVDAKSEMENSDAATPPQNNENHPSSFIISGFKKGYKFVTEGLNFFTPKSKISEDVSYTKIIFHAHFPKVHVGIPVIVGNIEELGKWIKPKIFLKQYKKNRSYWYSDPIQIPNVRFQDSVRYKYAVCKVNNQNYLNLEYEGSGPDDDRELEIQRQQFDIWKNNSAYRINQITDYMFLNVIYKSENIKEMVIDYDNILKQHHDLTLSVTNLEFISKHVSDKSIDRRLFLCFLLEQTKIFELPREFKTAHLLQAFFTVDQYTFPSDSMHV